MQRRERWQSRERMGTEGKTRDLKIYECEQIPFRVIDTIGFEPAFFREQKAIHAVKKCSRDSAKAGHEDNKINAIAKIYGIKIRSHPNRNVTVCAGTCSPPAQIPPETACPVSILCHGLPGRNGGGHDVFSHRKTVSPFFLVFSGNRLFFYRDILKSRTANNVFQFFN